MSEAHPIIEGLVVLLFLTPLALACLWLFMTLINKQQGLNFHAAFGKIEENPLACAVYFGLRFCGVCWLIGTLFSRYV